MQSLPQSAHESVPFQCILIQFDFGDVGWCRFYPLARPLALFEKAFDLINTSFPSLAFFISRR